MTAIENLKNSLIDRILISKNKKLLAAINDIFESTQAEEVLHLSPDQVEMLMMSEQDIEKGSIISDSELEKLDSRWLS